MSNPLEDMIKKFSESIPEPLRTMQDDMEKNMRGIMESGLQKMNLVTREEFDIQTAVLQRTREKLEALEKRVAELESCCLPERGQQVGDEQGQV
ncbi:MAG: accessory factor UbiK family protein [Thiolinea sp.]